jgi:hypothetical protein
VGFEDSCSVGLDGQSRRGHDLNEKNGIVSKEFSAMSSDFCRVKDVVDNERKVPCISSQWTPPTRPRSLMCALYTTLCGRSRLCSNNDKKWYIKSPLRPHSFQLVEDHQPHAESTVCDSEFSSRRWNAPIFSIALAAPPLVACRKNLAWSCRLGE